VGNGARAEYMSVQLFNKLPKRDLANSMKVALDRAYGREVTEQEILDFVNNERKLLNRREIK
jgi:hypothetical protein